MALFRIATASENDDQTNTLDNLHDIELRNVLTGNQLYTTV